MYIGQNNKSKYNYRAIAGILSLRKKYTDEIINHACYRAYTYGALRYKTVKQICEKGLTNLPIASDQTYINKIPNSVSRSLSEYSKLLH
ncbi:MAG: hypothetical protein PWP27_2621 [Clostridiales bacterium]|jgi:hypothetical protein|nr:hypothetical protein [Clostridiales bacterium]MDK2934811.1 hypothetical protein [Clostridiales bacterium]